MNCRVSIAVIAALCGCGHIVNASDPRPGELAAQAATAIRAGDLQSGVSLLQTAIESDATRARLSSFDIRQTVTPSALAHGREQFRRLSRDRPRLLEHSESAGFDRLVTWATRKFAGEGLGFTVDWNSAAPSDPQFGHVAEHTGPFYGSPAQIRISEVYPSGQQGGKQLSGEKLWSALVFELINLSNSRAMNRFDQQALAGNLSRTQYVSEIFRLEHRAVQLTQEFYLRHYLPWARAASVPTEPEHWFVCDRARAWWETAEESLDQFPFGSNYPWLDYGEQFDRMRQQSNAQPRKVRRSTASFGEQSPAQLAKQGTDAIRRGDLEAGLSRLRKAIESRNRREGILRAADDRTVLSDEALEHGRDQFRRLTRDRPILLRHADKPGFDRLSEWVIRRFSGEGSETTLDWDNAQPPSAIFGDTVEHTIPEGDIRGSVRIAAAYPTGSQAGKSIPFERVWSSLVIVLLDSSNASEFKRVKRQAHRGELSRAEYVTEMFHLSFRAVQLTQQFYAEYYLPWAIGAQIPSNPESWYVSDEGWWDGAEELLERYPFSSEYPWEFFGRQFDRIRRSPGAQPRRPTRRSRQWTSASITANPLKQAEHGRQEAPTAQCRPRQPVDIALPLRGH